MKQIDEYYQNQNILMNQKMQLENQYIENKFYERKKELDEQNKNNMENQEIYLKLQMELLENDKREHEIL